MADCLACDLITGREDLPGGQIWGDEHWFVDHCVGPLGLGTLVVLPVRHLIHVADLSAAETRPLGGILHAAARVTTELIGPEQVYVNLWSHADARPGHIHFVVQPVTRQTMDHFAGRFGPSLQAAMFRAAEPEPNEAVEAFADAARLMFRQLKGEAIWHGAFSP